MWCVAIEVGDGPVSRGNADERIPADEAVRPDVARGAEIPIDLEERAAENPDADERARFAEVRRVEVPLFFARRDRLGDAVGEAERDAVVRLRHVAGRGVDALVEHAPEEAPVDALAEADRDAAVRRVPLLLRLAPERVPVELVEGRVSPTAEGVVAVVERADASGALIARERGVAGAFAGPGGEEGVAEGQHPEECRV